MERGSRQTRSQAAPDWSLEECLTLVNEISSVESEWQHTLASFQIWQLVVENYNALHVNNRSLNQCKTKWDALLADFNKVKSCRSRSYWSFHPHKRDELHLPQEFDSQLFTAMDAYLNHKDVVDTDPDPDTDPDIPATTSNNNVFSWQNGPKKQRRKIAPRKRKFEENFQPWRHSMIDNTKHEPLTLSKVPELPRKAEVILDQGIEDEEGNKLATQISENIELMNAVLQENVDDDFDCKLSDLKNLEAKQLDITRLKGDRLIDCLGIVVNTLNQLCDHVQACK